MITNKETAKTKTWNDLLEFGKAHTDPWTEADIAQAFSLAESLDPSTIPDDIEIPDLRPREMIEAETREKRAKKQS